MTAEVRVGKGRELVTTENLKRKKKEKIQSELGRQRRRKARKTGWQLKGAAEERILERKREAVDEKERGLTDLHTFTGGFFHQGCIRSRWVFREIRSSFKVILSFILSRLCIIGLCNQEFRCLFFAFTSFSCSCVVHSNLGSILRVLCYDES